ncbi:MAG: hypothetical protein CMF55_06995 [Legionellales bacterium]|nr:hypothetical protein [Legionellales bacterium]
MIVIAIKLFPQCASQGPQGESAEKCDRGPHLQERESSDSKDVTGSDENDTTLEIARAATGVFKMNFIKPPVILV